MELKELLKHPVIFQRLCRHDEHHCISGGMYGPDAELVKEIDDWVTENQGQFKAHHIVFVSRGYDGYTKYDAKLDYGVFFNKRLAQQKIDELNGPIREKYYRNAEEKRRKLIAAQQRWDVLSEHGLEQGNRPVGMCPLTVSGEIKPWSPNSDEGYYDLEMVNVIL